MDKATLVDRDIEAGRHLIQALDQAGFPVVAAFWNVFSEENTWRLVIASPKVGELGPKEAYAVIQDVLFKSQIDLPLYRISAMNPDEPLVAAIRLFMTTPAAPFIGGVQVQDTSIGDMFIEGAYIYRAASIIGMTGVFDLWAVRPEKSRKLWIARLCKVTVVEGFFKKIEVQGFNWPQTNTTNGISTHLNVLANPAKRDGETFSDVQRWTIIAGRLRSTETIARGVRIEGFVENPSSAGATM
jgi:hypothetical protein